MIEELWGRRFYFSANHAHFGACPAMYSVSSGVLSLGLKQLDHKAGSTAPYRAEVKNVWCCSLTV